MLHTTYSNWPEEQREELFPPNSSHCCSWLVVIHVTWPCRIDHTTGTAVSILENGVAFQNDFKKIKKMSQQNPHEKGKDKENYRVIHSNDPGWSLEKNRIKKNRPWNSGQMKRCCELHLFRVEGRFQWAILLLSTTVSWEDSSWCMVEEWGNAYGMEHKILGKFFCYMDHQILAQIPTEVWVSLYSISYLRHSELNWTWSWEKLFWVRIGLIFFSVQKPGPCGISRLSQSLIGLQMSQDPGQDGARPIQIYFSTYFGLCPDFKSMP